MNIQEFVSESLKQILAGVQDAQENLKDSKSQATIGVVRTSTGYSPSLQDVEFDLAVYSIDSKDNDLSGKVAVAGVFSFGGGGKQNISEKTINRIKFSVPIRYPVQQNK